MTRKKIVAGNWKLNTSLVEGKELMSQLKNRIDIPGVKSIVIPPFTHLESAVNIFKDSGIEIGAQDCSKFENGAYTGEISANLLSEMGISYVIIGHSERRAYFGEEEPLLVEKIIMALKHRLTPIYCVGETLDQREDDLHFDVVKSQIENGLFSFSEEELKNCVIAYEPVWAIGTGKTASPEQAQEIHAYIRSVIADKYGDLAADITILYGGSVNDTNANALFSQPDIDGGLVGGASLKADAFEVIIRALASL